MKSNRRNFLKLSGLTGISMAGSNIASALNTQALNKPDDFNLKPGPHFNMSGYAAPKLEKVRIGFIGLGNRGPGAVMRMSKIEGVDMG